MKTEDACSQVNQFYQKIADLTQERNGLQRDLTEVNDAITSVDHLAHMSTGEIATELKSEIVRLTHVAGSLGSQINTLNEKIKAVLASYEALQKITKVTHTVPHRFLARCPHGGTTRKIIPSQPNPPASKLPGKARPIW